MHFFAHKIRARSRHPINASRSSSIEVQPSLGVGTTERQLGIAHLIQGELQTPTLTVHNRNAIPIHNKHQLFRVVSTYQRDQLADLLLRHDHFNESVDGLVRVLAVMRNSFWLGRIPSDATSAIPSGRYFHQYRVQDCAAVIRRGHQALDGSRCHCAYHQCSCSRALEATEYERAAGQTLMADNTTAS